jgi:hypothetical protein
MENRKPSPKRPLLTEMETKPLRLLKKFKIHALASLTRTNILKMG